MAEMRVGMRELKSKLSEYLRRVKAGETIIVTERGRMIGQIIPVKPTLEERMKALAEAGFLEYSGKKLNPYRPKIVNRSGRLISDIVVEDRR